MLRGAQQNGKSPIFSYFALRISDLDNTKAGVLSLLVLDGGASIQLNMSRLIKRYYRRVPTTMFKSVRSLRKCSGRVLFLYRFRRELIAEALRVQSKELWINK
jgi:hypothetical protein